MTETSTPALRVDSLTVRYGSVVALRDASVAIAAGRVCGLIGVNGSGKSTLFKAMIGTLRPNAGTVRIHGQDPEAARRTGRVGYLPQAEAIDWAFPVSVGEVVLTGRYARMGPTRRPRPADRDAVDRALTRVGLERHRDRQIGQLSGGQRKRVFLARCIAQGADVLLLDEPFAGVDKPSEATIIEVLRGLADAGATVLVASHDLQALPHLVDEAVLLMRTVLMHDRPGVVLQADNLALAFGLGATNAGSGPR